MWPLWSQFSFVLLALEMAEYKRHSPGEQIHAGSVLFYSLKGSPGPHSSHQASHSSRNYGEEFHRSKNPWGWRQEESAATGRAGFDFL